MTVAELIEELKDYPQDAEVLIDSTEIVGIGYYEMKFNGEKKKFVGIHDDMDDYEMMEGNLIDP